MGVEGRDGRDPKDPCRARAVEDEESPIDAGAVGELRNDHKPTRLVHSGQPRTTSLGSVELLSQVSDEGGAEAEPPDSICQPKRARMTAFSGKMSAFSPPEAVCPDRRGNSPNEKGAEPVAEATEERRRLASCWSTDCNVAISCLLSEAGTLILSAPAPTMANDSARERSDSRS
jgi:hypothetical protein